MKILAFSAALSLATLANSAAALEPNHPSQLVMLRAQSAPGFLPCPTAGSHFVEQFSDATFGAAPFTVDPGEVFVATSLQWTVVDGSATRPGEALAAAVSIQAKANAVAVIFSSAFAGPAGRGGGSETIPTGIRLAPGVEHDLCFTVGQFANPLTGTAILHGFVARDR